MNAEPTTTELDFISIELYIRDTIATIKKGVSFNTEYLKPVAIAFNGRKNFFKKTATLGSWIRRELLIINPKI